MRGTALAGLVGTLLSLPSLAAGATNALSVTPPRLEVAERTLANGLRVLLYEDHSVPIVNVELWVHVGSKNERPGRSGFAHLFEHIMFKGSANVASEEHKKFIASIGGRFNASTDFDKTLYWETVPSNYLERILWMEADRLRSLDISEANFRSERDVVKEERRQRVDNPPFGRLFEVVLKNTYTTHPYRILPIGSMADLDAATVEDVRAFHSTYYVPNNATLVIAGDFAPAQAVQWIETYFGSIPQGAAIPREVPTEPAQTAERRVRDAQANTPLPAVVLTYHVPQAGSADLYALEVASNILSSGESSRLYKRLVYEKQIAIQAAGQAIELEHPGVFFFYGILQSGQKPELGEQELVAEIGRLQSEPVTADELARSKNQILSGLVFGRQTVQQRAEAIGNAAVILGDLSLVNRQLAEYQKVSAADVQRVAQTYFRPENRTVVYMLPEEKPPAEKPAEKPQGAGR
jgi:zinc protease